MSTKDCLGPLFRPVPLPVEGGGRCSRWTGQANRPSTSSLSLHGRGDIVPRPVLHGSIGLFRHTSEGEIGC
ncbi:hypothetical protein DPEC_G00280240 [Dallia pectoralis]|uniref:Uncharacterized protein n=1 Tax=Dallia pectoralis TaxID=75939 RepID=A0ACC2FMJ0_DALPE|nr:hypothetical protein DPEC_G00280240 [Dallia pectoralis]